MTEEILTEEDIQQMREFMGANPDLTPHYDAPTDFWARMEKDTYREILELVDRDAIAEIDRLFPEADLQAFSDLVEGATITRNAND